jgi:hypothetical protein
MEDQEDPKTNQEKDFPVLSDPSMEKLLRASRNFSKPEIIRVAKYMKNMLNELIDYDFEEMLNYDSHFLSNGIKSLATRLKTYLRIVYNISNEEICCNYKNIF